MKDFFKIIKQLTNENKIGEFTLPFCTTYSGTKTKDGKKKDVVIREQIREYAINHISRPSPTLGKTFHFVLCGLKNGKRSIDVENMSKLVIDAFCIKQIIADNSKYTEAGLYPDDNINFVTSNFGIAFPSDKDEMAVKIFYF